MGLFKRGAVWWMKLTHQGKEIRKSTETSNRRLAERILSKTKISIIEGHYFDTSQETKRTFSAMMERYEKEHVAKKLSQRSYRGYTKNLRSFFGDCRLAEITPQLITEYKAKRYADGVKPATINRELAAIKNAFNLAIKEWEWCRTNPVSRVSMEKENNKRDRWLSAEEEKRLFREAPDWLSEITLFALHTGMRMGEILSLTWEGVDLFRKTVMVFHSKNGEKRTIPINQTVLGLLIAKSKVRSIQTKLVFCSQEYTSLDAHNLRRSFRAALEKAKIEDFHFHDLRHTFATRLIQSGVDIYKVQRLLGHKSPIMTQRYAHHYPESLRDGVEILDGRQGVGTILGTVAQKNEKGAGRSLPTP